MIIDNLFVKDNIGLVTKKGKVVKNRELVTFFHPIVHLLYVNNNFLSIK